MANKESKPNTKMILGILAAIVVIGAIIVLVIPKSAPYSTPGSNSSTIQPTATVCPYGYICGIEANGCAAQGAIYNCPNKPVNTSTTTVAPPAPSTTVSQGAPVDNSPFTMNFSSVSCGVKWTPNGLLYLVALKANGTITGPVNGTAFINKLIYNPPQSGGLVWAGGFGSMACAAWHSYGSSCTREPGQPATTSFAANDSEVGYPDTAIIGPYAFQVYVYYPSGSTRSNLSGGQQYNLTASNEVKCIRPS